MAVVNILFWILLGLYFLSISFPYHEIVLGILALIIGLDMLIAMIRRGG